MNARTRHLIALVEGGATLQDAGNVYGITRERVRQILKTEGVSAVPMRGGASAVAPPDGPGEPIAPRADRPREMASAIAPELERFRGDLRAGGLRESTIHSYLSGATLFVRWLAGNYVPGK